MTAQLETRSVSKGSGPVIAQPFPTVNDNEQPTACEKMRIPVDLFTKTLLSLSMLLHFGASVCDAQPKPTDEQPVRERNRTSELNEAELGRWSFTSQEASDGLEVSAKPVMRWSYFDIGRYYGDLHIVTAKGRPVAVFAMFRWFDPVTRAYVCGTALDDSKVIARRNGLALWQPRESGLQWKPIPDAKRPGNTAPSRLVQMRHYARRFSGEVSERREADRAAFKKVRLLPQPIYRYSTDSTDGAIFAFANGTTPAVLLCMEADLKPGAERWRYGFARRWSFESRMSYENEEVWVAPSRRPVIKSDESYYLSIIPQ